MPTDYTQTSNANLKISELAEAADVGVETIRYYENERIIEQPPKPSQGHRLYPSAFIGRIRFVKCIQSLGYNLQEIKELLSLLDKATDSSTHSGTRVQELLEGKIDELSKAKDSLDIKIAILKELRTLTTPKLLSFFQIYSKTGLRSEGASSSEQNP